MTTFRKKVYVNGSWKGELMLDDRGGDIEIKDARPREKTAYEVLRERKIQAFNLSMGRPLDGGLEPSKDIYFRGSYVGQTRGDTWYLESAGGILQSTFPELRDKPKHPQRQTNVERQETVREYNPNTHRSEEVPKGTKFEYDFTTHSYLPVPEGGRLEYDFVTRRQVVVPEDHELEWNPFTRRSEIVPKK